MGIAREIYMTKQQMMMSRLAPLLGSHLWAGNINTRFTLWLEDIFMSPFLAVGGFSRLKRLRGLWKMFLVRTFFKARVRRFGLVLLAIGSHFAFCNQTGLVRVGSFVGRRAGGKGTGISDDSIESCTF